ncbi:MAG: CoA ester lyase [Deltaproteobacteria bacterium]|nr:CoA ester lyase [Deltaproteobacteria bacterium]
MKPRRSILSVPGHVEKMHPKARQSRADVVMLDLEDSVPPEAKETARTAVVNALRTIDWGAKIVTARINALDTPFGYRDLLVLAEEAGERLDAVVIPKVDDRADIHFADKMLTGIEMARGLSARIGLEAIIESARGLANVGEIAAASDRLATLIFGVADYSASIGARLASISGHGEKEEDLYPGHRWHFAMSRLVMAAKAHGLMAIDAPYGNFKDTSGLRRAAVMAAALGCDGKWAIHPEQLDTINAVFSPAPADIERARRVIAAYSEAQAAGRGAVSVDGRMVDRASLRLAQQLWEQARHLKLV